MKANDTIVAIATSTSSLAALNIIRLSGDKSFPILQNLIKSDVKNLEKRKAHHVILKYKNRIIDDALIVLFEKKSSFCGEDTVEFNIHGSPLIAYDLLKILIELGARMARKGEFSYKAVINGKMNVLEAERINVLIHAKTSEGSQKILSSFAQDFLKPLKDIKAKIEYLYAYFLQVLDYPEEFNDEDDKVCKRIDEVLCIVDEIIRGTKKNNYLFSGVKAAIIGQPNVGKSTLLNMIVGEDKAIVTPIEGTTRDVVSGEKIISGVPFVFLDTAGLRESEDVIEQIGIQKSFEAIKDSDIILLLSIDGKFDKEYLEKVYDIIEQKPVIKVQTKSDIKESCWDEAELQINSQSDLCDLYNILLKKLDLVDLTDQGLFSLEDLTKLELIKRSLIKCKDDFKNESSYDILTINLNQVYQEIKELVGEEYDPNEIYDVIFSNFCVGK